MSNVRKDYRQAFEVSEGAEDALTEVVAMGLESLKRGRPAAYPDDAAGLESFKTKVYEYCERIQRHNDGKEDNQKIIPDNESMCAFLGITRGTLLSYAERSKEWEDFIEQAKQLLTAGKKQLIFRGKVPPVIGIFDLTNNSGYLSTNQFTMQVESKDANQKTQSRAEIAERYGYPSIEEVAENDASECD